MRLLALVLTLFLLTPIDDLCAALLPAQAADVQATDDDECLAPPAPAEQDRPSRPAPAPRSSEALHGRAMRLIAVPCAAAPSPHLAGPDLLYALMSLRR